MVTILESGILEHFTIIFSLVFVIAIVYGIFQMAKIFGDNKGLHGIIALVVGLLVIMVPDITKIISVMIPWFALLFIFILFVLVAYKIFGASDEDIAGVLKSDNVVIWVIVIIVIVIVVASFSNVYGQRLLSESSENGGEASDSGAESRDDGTGTPSFGQNVSATIFHPKVLGMLFILIVAIFTISLLAMKSKP